VNDSVRTWPALDISPVSELLQAALVDYDVCAVDERSSDEWRVFFTSGGERDRAAGGLRIEFPDLAIESVDVPDENWAARSQASLRAVRVGRIAVAPPWDIPAGPQSRTRPTDDIVIVIQPSMGFGTGHHATTRLCLAALQRLELHGRSVIDVGTGSGVLAIAASLLGATHVVGIDDDADAIASAQENLDLNGNAHVTLAVADLRSTPLAPVDVVVANLTGGLLIATASTLRGLVAGGGSLVLSGLMSGEESDVLAAFAPWRVDHRAGEDEWVCCTLVRS
jgi:ribosomal protein L11 methyltransferase